MVAGNDAPENAPGTNYSEQEKIQEFIRELALAFRRITGRKIEMNLDGLPVDLGKTGDQSDENAGQSVSDQNE